jgi:hypothetical protein
VRTSVMGNRSLIFRTCGRHIHFNVSDLSVLKVEFKFHCVVLALDLYVLCVDEFWDLVLL